MRAFGALTAVLLPVVAASSAFAAPASQILSACCGGGGSGGSGGSGSLIICMEGADEWVAASGTSESGSNVAFGLRDGECRTSSVPGGRYLVQIQGGHPTSCGGAISYGSCEVGRNSFDHTKVHSNVNGSYARFDTPSVDVNVAGGGTTTVTFIFAERNV